ncbi:PIN domain-containing protein [bacterium]|nr:PIN domain-containing protein [bacterium]
MSRYVLDSCVLFRALRPEGRATLLWIKDNIGRSLVPAFVDLEFYAGCKEAKKQTRYHRLRDQLATIRVGHREIEKALALLRRSETQGPGASDAVVGAAAVLASASVATFNLKHFRALGVPAFAPPQ